MSDDLNIKITGDPQGFKDAMSQVGAEADKLQGRLNETARAAEGIFASLGLEKIAEFSKEAFNVLKEKLVESVKEYESADTASRQLTNSMQNQGIFSTELKAKYDEQAESVEKLTGYSKTQITSAQAVAQTYLKQIPITEELTKAFADYAAYSGTTVPQAAAVLSREIATGTGMLSRQGLVFNSTATAAERMATTLEFVQAKAGDAAVSINPLELAQRKLNATIEANNVALGERFAPALTFATNLLNNFLTPSKDANSIMVDLKTSLIAVGFGVTAVGVGLPILGQAILSVRAAAAAFNITLNGTKIALAGLGIGLLIILVTELALHWRETAGAIIEATKGMADFVSKTFEGLGHVLKGALTLNVDEIVLGLSRIAESFKGIGDHAVDGWKRAGDAAKKGAEEQNAAKKKLADEEAQLLLENEAEIVAVTKAKNQLLALENAHASKETIALKQQEVQVLSAIQANDNDDTEVLLQKHLKEIHKLQANQAVEDVAQAKQAGAARNAADAELRRQGLADTSIINQKELQVIEAGALSEKGADQKIAADTLSRKVKANNQKLEDQKRYGIAYAAINQVMNSAEVQGTKQATEDLVQLTQSKNSTLKSIGKIATIANIVIKTAESAMNIYAGFSAIPIIGPALGIAGAAAAIAFGVEQVGNVNAAATGALVQGTGYGDKIPYLLEPGELVTPRQDFDDVVNGVIAQRGGNAAQADNSGGQAHVQISLKDNLMDFVETKLVERQKLGISIQRS